MIPHHLLLCSITDSTHALGKLRHLTELCEFGATLHIMLQNKLFYSMEEIRIQRQLLVERDLIFDKAFELVSAAEAADRNAKT